MVDLPTRNLSEDDRLARLLIGFAEGDLNESEMAEWDAALAQSEELQELLIATCLQRQLLPQVLADVANETPAVVPAVPPTSPALGFLGNITHGAFTYFSEGWPLAYLLGTIIFGLGLGIFSLITVNHRTQIAEKSPSSSLKSSEPMPALVGRITGMIDAQWSDINTSTDLGNSVFLGRKYALASGLMEITYETGAKVILQGPVTYEVDSPAGGYLSVGKLTARLEKKRSGGRGQGSEAANHKLEIINHKSLAPVFAIRTPTAVVTDLGTEFGVEVDKDGRTETNVFVGEVVATDLGRPSEPTRSVHLKAGEGAVIDNRHTGITTWVLSAEKKQFIRLMPQPPTPSMVLVRDEANRPAYLSGWRNGDWSGDGWDCGWRLAENGTCSYCIASAYGNDVGSNSYGKAQIDTEQRSFGLAAKREIASAVRDFAFHDLPINATFMIDLDTGQTQQGSSMGFGLLNAEGEYRFEFAIADGRNTYSLHDAQGTFTYFSFGDIRAFETNIPYTDKGLHLELTRINIDAYRLKVVRLENNREYTFERRFADRPADKNVRKLRVWNYSYSNEPERTLYFNRLRVIAPRTEAK